MQDFSEEPTDEMHRTLGGNLGVTRRGFMRATAAAGGAAAVGVGADRAGLQPVGEADALVTEAITDYAEFQLGGGVIGWALREWDPLGSDNPPEGLTPEALQQSAYESIRKRSSENRSTFVDNRNILDGLKHSLYVDAKLAAIEALNNGDSQTDVEAAATAVVEDYGSTVQENLLKSWNESLREISNIETSLKNHSDLTYDDHLMGLVPYGGSTDANYRERKYPHGYGDSTVSVSLVDGSSFEVLAFSAEYSDDDPYYFGNLEGSQLEVQIILFSKSGLSGNGYYFDGGGADYQVPGDSLYSLSENSDFAAVLHMSTWNGIWTDIETIINNVKDGIILWADSVYGSVQSGEIEVSDLITPRERAAMMSEDEEFPQAVADLLALNVPVDLERKATIEIPSKNATLVGTIGVTDDTQEMQSGTTYSPSDFGSVYVTYDMSKGQGDWSEYQSGVDGGTVTFSSEPYADTKYRIHTTAGEQADVVTADFVDGGDGTWTVDVSDQLETPITEVDSVDFFADVDTTEYRTVQITDDFTVTKFEDSDGNEHESANFESSEPQDDTNYITQEEWDELVAKNEELIKKYQESKDDSSGTGWLDFGGGSSAIGIVAIAAAALGAILLGNNN